ncbi:hypothetical protein ACPPVV_04340 [Rhodanobacter sp. Col0626]|uniref:hypothetical protein n=1 Tax=Rhodanobacter sp. Col0626 TaxID=3415679 RepID=UPI003CE76656
MRQLLLVAALLLLLLGAMMHWRHRPLHAVPGVLAANVPEQVDLDHGNQLQRGNVTLATRAHFDLTARVLSRKDYSWGEDADLIPMDLVLGWGRMSDSDVLSKIDISQSARFYHWQVQQFPIPRREIETSSANMHMIPADESVKQQLAQVRQGQLVHIEGFLVDASRADGWHWHTSMTRDDTGAGACELIYVESLDIVTP